MALSQILYQFFFFLTEYISTWTVEVGRGHSKFLCLYFLVCAGGNLTSGPMYTRQVLSTFNFRLLPLVSGMKFEQQVI